MCNNRIFHNWKKWEVVKSGYGHFVFSTLVNDDDMDLKYYEDQRRECEACGKSQVRRVVT